jgi:solute carrier family 39 (zinc transporter), member 9
MTCSARIAKSPPRNRRIWQSGGSRWTGDFVGSSLSRWNKESNVKPLKSAFWTPILVIAIIVLTGCGEASNTPKTTTGFAIAVALITLVAALSAGAVPLSGMRNHENLLRWATGLAAGFMISSVLMVAIPEGFEMVFTANEGIHTHHNSEVLHDEAGYETEAHRDNPEPEKQLFFGGNLHQLAGFALLAGFMLMLVLESLGFGHDLHEEHHHHSEASDESHIHHPTVKPDARYGLAATIVIGLSVHALADGLAIGAALATGSISLTVPLMLGMVMHKMPAAFSLAAFSQHSHGNVRQTWRELIIFSLATPVALLVAFQILGDLETHWLGLTILVSAGTFLYVAAVDVLPNMIHDGTRKSVLLQVFIGTLVILVVLSGLEFFGLVSHVH